MTPKATPRKWALPQITVGNWMTIGAFIIVAITMWVKVGAHMEDKNIHRQVVEVQQIVKDQFNLLVAPYQHDNAEVIRRLDVMERKMDQLIILSRE